MSDGKKIKRSRDVDFSTYRRGKNSCENGDGNGNNVFDDILAKMNKSNESNGGDKGNNDD